MVSVTLKITNEFKELINKLSWVNWSEITREEAIKRLEEEITIDEFKRIVSKSKLTDEDALRLGREVNEALHKRYKKLYRELS